MDPIIASEETVEIPLTPERIHPKDATTSRRNSTGRVSTSNSGEKILPHYLRASTNSCHDLCKYGRHHASEAKEKYPIPKRFTAVASKIQIPGKSSTLQEKKKTLLVVKPKSLPEPKTQAPDKLKIVKRDIKIVTREVSSPSKKINVAVKVANGSKPPLSPPMKLDVTPKPPTGEKPKPVTAKLSSSSLNNSSGGRRNSDIGIASNTISRRRSSDIGIVNNTRSSKLGERKSSVPPSSPSPKPSGNGVSSLSSRKPRVLKATTPLKNQSLVRKAEPKLPNDDKLKEKTLYAIEPKPEKKLSSLSTSARNRPPSISGSRSPYTNGSHSNRSLSVSGSRSPNINGSHSNRSPSISGSRSPSINGSHSNRSPSISGSRSSRTSLYSSSMYSSLSSSQSLCTDDEEEQRYGSDSSKPKEIKNGSQVTTTSKTKYQRTRIGMVHSEERDLARKLKFRRGKVVNPGDEINESRRLRFKQGRVLGDNQKMKGDVKRRSFGKRKDEGDKNGKKPESEKVVLRHQDVQVTKDAQGLFNNVIEETASKLVESRKSKVKALVGAFETVISLQETKPAA